MTVDPSGRAVRSTLASRGWLEREARVAVETQPLRQALNQREHYTDLRGVNHPLSAMSTGEASLVLALLERHAVTLHRGELAEQLLRLEENMWQPMAAVEAYGVLAATAAENWLRQTPLHRALTERIGQWVGRVVAVGGGEPTLAGHRIRWCSFSRARMFGSCWILRR